MVLLRQAVEKDIPDIIRLLCQVNDVHASGRPDIFISGKKKYDETQLVAILAQEKTPVYVAEENDEVCGYAFCIIEESNGENLVPLRRLYIDDLCVDEHRRGGGIGTLLYNYVKKEAKKLGCYHITLNVWQLNESAMRFYNKLGMNVLKQTMEEIL